MADNPILMELIPSADPVKLGSLTVNLVAVVLKPAFECKNPPFLLIINKLKRLRTLEDFFPSFFCGGGGGAGRVWNLRTDIIRRLSVGITN